ncbi:asparagine synthase (glutamine-hydrolyzing) [Candidatus Kaiserbacteria bacterium]|nr:asparagine synthase (glutamine-hydrolyzing) [Candidatus Kaiserbacteria bacterium]
MCGILGITERNDELVRDAAKTFAYRGPDASRILSDSAVTMGHNRLAIIDLNPRSTQPMTDPDDTTRLMFNGEIYNYKSLRSQLEAKGYEFRTESDTEVLLNGYKEWGNDIVGKLRGMYAIAIHDRTNQRLVLITDYAGMKPIFYARIGEVLAFASEMKGVTHMLRAKGITPEVDTEALSLYWSLGYSVAPRTIFKDVSRMPRRTILTMDLASGKKTETHYALPTPTAVSEGDLKQLIETAVKRHLVADVPVGLFFSGGTDSSLIASILKKLGKRLEAFSLELAAHPEDSSYFDKIAKHMSLSIHRFFFGVKEFDEIYPMIVEKIDEPIYDSSLFPLFYIAREAARHVKVVLSGDAGDEYFLGYPRSQTLSHLHDAPLDRDLTLLDRAYVLLPRFRGKVRLFEKLFVFFRKPVSYYVLVTGPSKDYISIADWRRAKRALSANGTTPVSFDADYYLENDLLRKADLATMYNSIEGRIPLLDPDVVSSGISLMRNMVPIQELKPVLKRILATYLPHDLVYRGKRGFGLDASVFFGSSKYLKEDLRSAQAYLATRGLQPRGGFPATETMITRRPQMAWQTIMLYHALKNAHI